MPVCVSKYAPHLVRGPRSLRRSPHRTALRAEPRCVRLVSKLGGAWCVRYACTCRCYMLKSNANNANNANNNTAKAGAVHSWLHSITLSEAVHHSWLPTSAMLSWRSTYRHVVPERCELRSTVEHALDHLGLCVCGVCVQSVEYVGVGAMK